MLQRRYVYGPGLQVVAMVDASRNWTYLHQDKRNSTIATSNPAGAVTQVYTYGLYGQTTESTGVPFLYTGHRLDAETGLYYTPARYYDPMTGSWLVQDRIGRMDGLNEFLYVHADPVNMTDPSGTVAGVDDAVEATVGVGILGVTAAVAGYEYWAHTPDGQRSINGAAHAISESVDHRIQQIKSIVMSDNADKEGKAKQVDEDVGCIYCVKGEKTSSGKDYVGSTDNMGNRAKDKSDGRDREDAEVVDTYKKGDRDERRTKEQQAIDDRGGVKNLDNKRNEVAEKNWSGKGISSPGQNCTGSRLCQ